MDNKDSFEDIIKAKMNALEQTPSTNLKERLQDKLSQQSITYSYWKKAILFSVICVLIGSLSKLLYTSPYFSATTNINQNLSLNDKLTPLYLPKAIQSTIYTDFLEKGEKEKKLVFLNIFNDSCKECLEKRKQTFANKKVKNILDKYFIQVDFNSNKKTSQEQIKPYDSRQNKEVTKKIVELFGKHQIAFLFKGKIWVVPLNKYPTPDEFSKLLQLVIEKAFKNKINNQEEAAIANYLELDKFHKDTNHGHDKHSVNAIIEKDKLLVVQTPDDIKNKPYIEARRQAQAEQKMIFIHAFNMDCSHCQKMRDSTLANPAVKEFLAEHFVKIDIDLQLLENKEVAQYYDIKTSPKFLFLNGKGQLITIANGFQAPTKFIQILENAMEEEAAGSYIDLMTKKRLNPVPGKLQKINPLINVDLPDSFLLKVATSKKLILINVYAADCEKCEKLEKITFKDKNVENLLSTRFARWTINAEQAKSLGLFQQSNKYSTPATFIFSNQGTWISSFSGYMPPNPFLKTLKKSLTQNAFQYKGIQHLKANVFPNPTKGRFNIELKGQQTPLFIRIIDLHGKVILEEKHTTFNGEEKFEYDLTGQKGHYIIQFSQEKSTIYKKVVIQ